ncbi:MAG: histidine ammonia-lyase [Deltaproteobacteria bacterium]|nr:histidine ammonia-lyase [Deltaproteobacteria bacterium]
MKEVLLGRQELSLEDLTAVARNKAPVRLVPEARKRVERARKLVENWVAQGRVVYGVTTGFGALCGESISAKDARRLQENVLMSHAAGVGRPLAEEIVRAMMAIRVQDLAQGCSGIRLKTLLGLIDFLNKGLSPVVPEKGSVGASGDLAPMAHLALVMIGQGEAFFQGLRLPGPEALAQAGLEPIQLEAGEGLALINGTQTMTAITALAVHDADRLLKTADIACALSLEVLMGTNAEFDPRIHRIRPHPGQAAAADNMDRLTRDSEIISSHKDCSRIQDAYTLRCSPQIHGASKDALSHVRQVVGIELNSSTTNPLILPQTADFLLGGNFHGQPMALAADYLSLALAETASVSERRIERLVNPQLSGLPAFLVQESGLNSGLMIAQYTAAALVSENKVLAHPACVDSIPTSANKEDHVSMGTISARKCRSILQNAEYVVAIELLCGAQALDLLTKGRPGRGTEQAYLTIRKSIPRLDQDRVLAQDIETMVQLVRSGQLVTSVESAVGPLK